VSEKIITGLEAIGRERAGELKNIGYWKVLRNFAENEGGTQLFHF
jgi:hypothetical protein